MLKSFNEPRQNYVMSQAEALTKINYTYMGKMDIVDDFYVSDWQAAKKIYHAMEFGINPEDYGMSRDNLKLIEKHGLTRYVRMGKPLPPTNLVKAYQCALKDFCEKAKANDSTYNSRGEQLSHQAKSYIKKDSNIIITFKKSTEDLITGGAYGERSYINFLETKVLGKLNK